MGLAGITGRLPARLPALGEVAPAAEIAAAAELIRKARRPALVCGGGAHGSDAIQEADLIIWCGAKVSQNTGMNRTLPKPDQATITIGFDPLEHGRSFRPTVALLGDMRDTVLALDAAKGASRAGANPEWDARIAEVKARCDAAKAEEMASSQLPILPPRIMAEIAARLGRTMSSCPTPRSRRAGSRATSRPNRSGGSSCPRAGRAGRRS